MNRKFVASLAERVIESNCNLQVSAVKNYGKKVN